TVERRVTMDSTHVIQPGSSRAGRWLEARRFRLAIWISVAEALIVLFSKDLTKVAVAALAVAAVVAWFLGRESRHQVVREALWIFAVSQLLASLAAFLGFLVKWALIT